MKGSLTVSRGTPMKIAAALVVTGAASIGLAACGSGSGSNTTASSGQNRSTSSVPKKTGIYKGVHLTVISKDPVGVTAVICATNVSCKPAEKLVVDGRVDMANTNSSYGEIPDVDAYITWADGKTIHVSAYNPGTIGAPRIKGDPTEYSWVFTSEGQCFDTRQLVYPVEGRRGADTSDYKVMSVTVFPPRYTGPLCGKAQGG